MHTPWHCPRLSIFIKSSEQVNYLANNRLSCSGGILSRANEILCYSNEILSSSDET